MVKMGFFERACMGMRMFMGACVRACLARSKARVFGVVKNHARARRLTRAVNVDGTPGSFVIAVCNCSGDFQGNTVVHLSSRSCERSCILLPSP